MRNLPTRSTSESPAQPETKIAAASHSSFFVRLILPRYIAPSPEHGIPLADQISIIRRVGNTVKYRISAQLLSAIALDGPQRQIVAGLRGKGCSPFERYDDPDALVEAAFAETDCRDVGERKPGADLYPGGKSSEEFE